MNANEIAELEQVLNEIDALNLKDVFQNNLRVVCFKKVFLDRLKVFLTNNLAFLNEDNTFISELYNISFASRIQFCIDNGFIFMNGNKFIKELYDAEDFGSYTAGKPLQEIRSAEEVREPVAMNAEDLQAKMDPEDRQVYNQIIESLNYLVLQNTTNEYLPIVVRNITDKVKEAILRKEYRFLPLRDVIDGVMFDGIDVTPEMENIRELVLSAFPEELKQSEGRGVA